MSKRGAVARRAGVTAIGVVSPWAWPVRAVAVGTAVARRRQRRSRRRVPVRTLAVITGVVGVGGAAVATVLVVRSRTGTPQPVAAHPPRVEEVPTADDPDLPRSAGE